MATVEIVSHDLDDPRRASISSHRIGLALAVLLVSWHVLWSIMVAAGWGQAAIDFVFWLHFITPPYTVGSFVLSRAVALIAVSATLGYVLGLLIGVIWNGVHERSRSRTVSS